MTSRDVANLHPRDIPLWLAVETAVWRLAVAANCELKLVEPLPKRWVGTWAGLYHYAPARKIQIGLRQKYRRTKRFEEWGPRYPLHVILDTIAHEVAHGVVGRERVGDGHGPKFFRAFGRMLLLAEDIGIRFDINASRVTLLP